MLLSGIFRRPVLKFGKGTSLYPYEGFRLGLRPYKGPRRLRLGVLIPSNLRNKASIFMRNLIFGIRGYGGLTKWFNCYVNWPPLFIYGDYSDYVDLVDEFSDVDLVIAFIPDEYYCSFDEDPYLPVKQALALRGIPSQMVSFSTLRYLADKSYVLFNLALSIYGKVGGIPWIISDDLYADVYLGLDTVGNGVAITIFSIKNDIFFDWRIGLNPDVEVIRTLNDILKEALVIVNDKIGRVKRIIIHRDGRCFEEEVEAIKNVIDWGILHEFLDSDVEWAYIEVRKRIIPRIVGYRFNRLTNPEKGSFYVLDPFKYLVVTTGFPERPYILDTGLVRPIIVEMVEASNWEMDMYKVARDVYWLSELHWASAFSSSRLPITTLYAHRICSFWRVGIYPKEEFYERLWFL